MSKANETLEILQYNISYSYIDNNLLLFIIANAPTCFVEYIAS